MTEAATPASYKGWAGIKRAFGTPSALTMAMLGFGSTVVLSKFVLRRDIVE